MLALAGAGFRDHLQHRPGVLVRAHPSWGMETWRPLHFLVENPREMMDKPQSWGGGRRRVGVALECHRQDPAFLGEEVMGQK